MEKNTGYEYMIYRFVLGYSKHRLGRTWTRIIKRKKKEGKKERKKYMESNQTQTNRPGQLAEFWSRGIDIRAYKQTLTASKLLGTNLPWLLEQIYLSGQQSRIGASAACVEFTFCGLVFCC